MTPILVWIAIVLIIALVMMAAELSLADVEELAAKATEDEKEYFEGPSGLIYITRYIDRFACVKVLAKHNQDLSFASVDELTSDKATGLESFGAALYNVVVIGHKLDDKCIEEVLPWDKVPPRDRDALFNHIILTLKLDPKSLREAEIFRQNASGQGDRGTGGK